MQNLSHGSQLQAVIVLQLKNHALARRQFLQRSRNPRAQLAPHQIALWIRARAPVCHLIEQVVLAAVGVFCDRRVFFAHGPFAQVIETQVRHDPVNPCVEGTLEPEAADVLISLEEGVLIHVLSVVFSSGEMQGQPQHRLVVMAHQFLEGGAVPALRLADQHRVIDAAILRLAI